MDLMRIASTGTAALPSASTGQAGRYPVLAGDVAHLLPNEPLAAIVRSVRAGQAVLDIGGTLLTVQTTDGALRPGAAVTVRFADTGRGVVDLGGGLTTTVTLAGSGRTAETPASASPTATAPAAAFTAVPREALPPAFSSPIVRAAVLAQLPDGQYLVRIEGNEVRVSSEEPLQAGAGYVRRAEVTQQGVTLRPLPDTPQLPGLIAAAVLRGIPERPPIGPALQAIAASPGESATLAEARSASLPRLLAALVPAAGRPPTADQLAAFVRDGGLLYEAKLARAPDADVRTVPTGDVKGAILRALQQVGSADKDAPLRTVLDSIESQQALNVLAAAMGEGVRLQFPIPDLPAWRTLDVSIAPADQGTNADRPGGNGFSILLHTEMTETGDTWVDARVEGKNFRAVLYVEHEAARQDAKRDLPELASELRTAGFTGVLLDVRGTADLRPSDRVHAMRGTAPVGAALLDVRA